MKPSFVFWVLLLASIALMFSPIHSASAFALAAAAMLRTIELQEYLEEQERIKGPKEGEK